MNDKPRLRSPEGTAADEHVISLEDVLRVVRQRMLVILLVTLLFAGAGLGFSLSRPPAYEASIKVLVAQEEGADVPGNLAGDVAGLQQLTNTVAEAIYSRPIAEEVIEQRGLDTNPDDFLSEDLDVEPVTDTQFVRVAYTDADPRRAARVANTVGEVFSERITGAIPNANAITATVWEPAVAPGDPANPSPLVYGLAASLLGLMAGLVLALLLDHRDDSLRSPEEAEQICGAPVFGTVPKFAVAKSGRMVRRGEDAASSPRGGNTADA